MKVLKVIRILFIVLTILVGLYGAYALFMVWGNKLLYLNVELGRWLARTYRWAWILFGVLVLIDLILGAFGRKKKAESKC